MGVRVESIESSTERSRLCESILRGLPEWFGIESAIDHYVEQAAGLPTLAGWREDDDDAVGFLSLKHHSPHSAEIYVMGVREDAHGRGLGTALIGSAEDLLRVEGVEYLQVKTLAPSHPSTAYARTRMFYEARGFRALEIFPTLWDEANPCLLLVKRI